MTDHSAAPVADLSYEQAREELVSIVARLESGHCTLEESMTLWERGEALANHCEHFLSTAQARIEGRPAAMAEKVDDQAEGDGPEEDEPEEDEPEEDEPEEDEAEEDEADDDPEDDELETPR